MLSNCRKKIFGVYGWFVVLVDINLFKLILPNQKPYGPIKINLKIYEFVNN